MRWAVGVTGGLMVVALWCAGCGKKEERKPTFPVSGQVFHQNKPAVGALVFLQPLQEADLSNWPTGFPRGNVQPDGSFAIGTYEQADGAPTGSYVALIRWQLEGTEGVEGSGGDRLKGAYADPKKSPFPVQVPQSAVTLKPFELK